MQRAIVDLALIFAFTNIIRIENTHAQAVWELIPESVKEPLDSTSTVIHELSFSLFNLPLFILIVHFPLSYLLVLLEP